MMRDVAYRERPANNVSITADLTHASLSLISHLYLSLLSQPAKGVQTFDAKPGQYLITDVG